MRILIISFFSPPANIIGAVRVGKIAKYLHRFGHDVRIISARSALDDQSLPVEIPQEHVTYTPWIDLRKPLAMLCGGRKKMDAIGAWSFTGNHRRIERIRTWLRATLFFPDDRSGWIPFAITGALKLIKVWSPDIIYASAPPYSSLVIARCLSSLTKIPWVGEFRDLWVDQEWYPYSGLRKHFDRKVEHWTCKKMTAAIAVSAPHRDLIATRFNKPTITVRNGFDREDYELVLPHIDKTPLLTIAYTGTIGTQYDPEPLLAALALHRASFVDRLKFVIAVPGPGFLWLKRLAEKHGVADFFECRGMLSFCGSVRLQSEADVLLFFACANIRCVGVYSGKIFEYLGARRPILAIGPESALPSQLVLERAAGVVSQDPSTISSQLLTWIAEKTAQGHIKRPPVSASKGLTREEQVKTIEQFLLQCAH